MDGMENGQLSLTLALNHGEKMMATQLSAEHLKEQINQLRQEIQTAGLPERPNAPGIIADVRSGHAPSRLGNGGTLCTECPALIETRGYGFVKKVSTLSVRPRFFSFRGRKEMAHPSGS